MNSTVPIVWRGRAWSCQSRRPSAALASKSGSLAAIERSRSMGFESMLGPVRATHHVRDPEAPPRVRRVAAQALEPSLEGFCVQAQDSRARAGRRHRPGATRRRCRRVDARRAVVRRPRELETLAPERADRPWRVRGRLRADRASAVTSLQVEHAMIAAAQRAVTSAAADRCANAVQTSLRVHPERVFRSRDVEEGRSCLI